MENQKNIKRLAILGSTGSIGKQTLQVAKHLQYPVSALAAAGNIDLLQQQIREFNPRLVAVFDEKKARELQKKVAPSVKVVAGIEGLEEVASCSDVDLVVSAITGSAGIAPTLAAIQNKKDVALANKEVLVAAGELIMKLAKEKNVKILPVDSEHSAIFQCLLAAQMESVRKLILTASGGPFFHFNDEMKSQITPSTALMHPTWKMGPKVTIDSSTLMNKGLEVIEAHHLFQMPIEKIDVVVHPQSVIHSMVEMIDGSIMAQMSEPNMIFPIQYALTHPKRSPGFLPAFPFHKYPKLEFFVLERGKFRCLDLAFASLQEGGSAPCYLNAANEVLVSRFLQNQISWLDIGKKLEILLMKHKREKALTLDVIYAVDACARKEAQII